MIEFKISYVSERDIDLMMVQELSSSIQFTSFVLSKVNLSEFKKIIQISHSLMHPTLGESDIVVKLDMGTHTHALFIENKIDAPAMQNQYQRYTIRAEEGLQKGEFNAYTILLIAPIRYLETNEEASKYPNRLSYESMLEYMGSNTVNASAYKSYLLHMAIDKEKSDYVPTPDENVTRFWQKYYSYKIQHFPHLIFMRLRVQEDQKPAGLGLEP